MKTKIIFPFLFLLMAAGVRAQKKDQLPPSQFFLNISYDNMFGFYPSVYGSFGVKENLSFTYYGVMWTNPSFGSQQTGTDSWLETGFGLGLHTPGGKWFFNPALALTHGKVLSGGEKGVVADGIAPGTTVLFQDGIMELETYVVWYKALRKKGLFTYDYALYWLLPGFVINENISLGLHYEGFVLTRKSHARPEQLYQAVGGYAKFTVGQKFIFRLSLGKNFKVSEYPEEFYKLTVFLPFL